MNTTGWLQILALIQAILRAIEDVFGDHDSKDEE